MLVRTCTSEYRYVGSRRYVPRHHPIKFYPNQIRGCVSICNDLDRKYVKRYGIHASIETAVSPKTAIFDPISMWFVWQLFKRSMYMADFQHIKWKNQWKTSVPRLLARKNFQFQQQKFQEASISFASWNFHSESESCRRQVTRYYQWNMPLTSKWNFLRAKVPEVLIRGMKVPGSERSREQKFQGAKFREVILGAKVHRSKKAIIRKRPQITESSFTLYKPWHLSCQKSFVRPGNLAFDLLTWKCYRKLSRTTCTKRELCDLPFWSLCSHRSHQTEWLLNVSSTGRFSDKMIPRQDFSHTYVINIAKKGGWNTAEMLTNC